MNIQAPPNLSPGRHRKVIDAGINDWGGISPVTPDFVNPEAPWPQLQQLSSVTRECGKTLVERLAIYPAYARDPLRWVTSDLRTALVRSVDTEGFPRTDGWSPGALMEAPLEMRGAGPVHIGRASALRPIIDRALAGRVLGERDIVALFGARDQAFASVCAAADELRRDRNGDSVTYVVNRNINYTNVCGYRCQFCAFAKGRTSEDLRGKPYDLSLDEIANRVVEARSRGATEVCMQGGIHPAYTGQTYLDICAAAKAAAPGIHVHAFSPLEVFQGAKTMNSNVDEFLRELRGAGLGTLPGTAAEILDDEVRATLCPDKIRTEQWLDVMRIAHKVGLRSTATIMFGHIERTEHWARHLLRVRALQEETGGFTEFVPLPFVHMESPIYRKGRARKGPTFRESVLMHAVARLALNPWIGNIQVSWVKMGVEGVRACLNAGVNDLGGTLMDESISRAAGAAHGQCMAPSSMTDICRSVGRTAKQRTTLYGSTEGG